MGPVRRLFQLGLGKPGIRDAVDWELEHYLEEQIERLVEQGFDRREAREEAERRLGGVARHRRKIMAADRRGLAMMKGRAFGDSVVSTLRYTLRGVRREPAFVVAVILTLSLGIGANAAMFGVVDRLLLRPPEHVVAPDQVRRVLREGLFFGDFGTFPATTYPDLEDLRTIPEFSSVGGVTGEQRLTVGAGEGARQVRAVLATHDFFATLGVRPHLGRFFGAQDDQPDAQATVVVSREYWETSMGAAPDVLGRTLELAGHPMTVIGVAPQGFTGVDLSPVDVWLPAVMAQKELTGRDRFLTSRTYWWLRSVVRVREGEAHH